MRNENYALFFQLLMLYSKFYFISVISDCYCCIYMLLYLRKKTQKYYSWKLFNRDEKIFDVSNFIWLFFKLYFRTSCDSSSFSRVTRTHAGWHMSQADITASQSFGAIRDFGAIRWDSITFRRSSHLIPFTFQSIPSTVTLIISSNHHHYWLLLFIVPSGLLLNRFELVILMIVFLMKMKRTQHFFIREEGFLVGTW